MRREASRALTDPQVAACNLAANLPEDTGEHASERPPRSPELISQVDNLREEHGHSEEERNGGLRQRGEARGELSSHSDGHTHGHTHSHSDDHYGGHAKGHSHHRIYRRVSANDENEFYALVSDNQIFYN